jgi:hypothetical protein
MENPQQNFMLPMILKQFTHENTNKQALVRID